MSSTQRKALSTYRRRLKRRGVVRLEVHVRKDDAALVRGVVKALADPWRTLTLFNPIVHVISGFRWSFYGVTDVPVWSSVAVTLAIIIGMI